MQPNTIRTTILKLLQTDESNFGPQAPFGLSISNKKATAFWTFAAFSVHFQINSPLSPLPRWLNIFMYFWSHCGWVVKVLATGAVGFKTQLVHRISQAVNGYPNLFRAGEGEGDETKGTSPHPSYTVAGPSWLSHSLFPISHYGICIKLYLHFVYFDFMFVDFCNRKRHFRSD